MDIAVFVVAIVAIAISFLPIINNLTFILALVAIVLGIVCAVKYKKDPNGKRKGFFFSGLIIAIVSIVIAFGTQGYYSTVLDNAANGTDATNSSSVKIKDSDIHASVTEENVSEDKYGNYKVTGKIVNDGTKNISSLCITYNVYNSDGDKIGTATDYCSTGLNVNETWAFSAGYYDRNKEFDHCELDSVKAY